MNDTSSTLSPRQRSRLIKSASYASLVVAASLVIAKAWAWQVTDSVSLLSSLADSVLDVMASALTFWAVRYSLSPADTEHRFGHGKSEGLAALVQSLIISASGVYVCVEAIDRLFSPQPIKGPEAGLLVIVAATAATILLVSYQHHVSRKTGSVAIGADAMHYKTDVLVNVGVALAIILTAWTGWQPIDPIVGLIIAAYILRGALQILTQAMDILLDREIPAEVRKNIRRLALSHPDVRGLHDMKTRFGGNHYIIQLHLELDPDISLYHSHEILDEVEDRIRKEYDRCDIIIHPDPLNYPEQREFTE